tara:strand:- start:20306 stop:20785 length:480 start_codon:yes stop_codon:yes gene_type:complete
MKSLSKVEDINNFKDGKFLIQHVKGVYCECGYEQGAMSGESAADFYSVKYNLMGLPVMDDENNIHFTMIDYDENKHKGFLYVDYDSYRAKATKEKMKNEERLLKEKMQNEERLLKNKIALEEGSTSLRERYLPGYKSSDESLTKKRKLNTGGKTRKKRG